MGAYAELQDGCGVAGAATFAMMRTVARRVLAKHKFPSPDGGYDWSQNDVDDLVADVATKTTRNGENVALVTMFTTAKDDSSLEALFYQSVHNHLKDRAKATAIGKLRRRLATLLTQDARFERPSPKALRDRWALVGREGRIWSGLIEDLLRAARRVRGHSVPYLNSAGKTPAPVIEALTTVSEGVLDFADSAVLDQELARVVHDRFDLAESPTTVSLPSGPTGQYEGPLLEDETRAWADAVSLDAQDQARFLWSRLSPQERAVFPVLAESLERRQAVTGLGPHGTEELCRGVQEMIVSATRDDEDKERVVVELMRLASFGSGNTSSSEGVDSTAAEVQK